MLLILLELERERGVFSWVMIGGEKTEGLIFDFFYWKGLDFSLCYGV